MAKVKETKVALKGEDPKKAPKASKTARRVPKHHEEVKVESDSSSSNRDSSSGSESDEDAEKRKNTKKPKLSRAKETEPNSPPVADDSSEDSSSDDDSSEAAAAPATINSNGAVKKGKDTKTKDNKTKESKSKEMVSDSSDSDSDSDSDDEHSADAGAAKSTAEEEDSDEEMEDAPAAVPAREPVDPTKAIAPQPFNPPAGYKPLDTKQASAKTLSSLLSNPGEKQVWHITAPSSVPLSKIQSISLAAIQNQTSILSHKDTDYTLAEEKASKTTKKLLVPGDKGYASSEVPVSRSLVLQQVISLPNLPKHKTSTAAPQSVLQRGKREPRPQPEGLRMRFKPIGYGAGEPGAVLGADESGDEDVDAVSAPSFRLPTTAESEKEKKRKRDAEEAAATPRSEKKRRKEKKNKKDDDDVEIMEGMEEEVHRAEKALVEGTKKEVPETEEEKARKKAEKKERKSKEKKAKK